MVNNFGTTTEPVRNRQVPGRLTLQAASSGPNGSGVMPRTWTSIRSMSTWMTNMELRKPGGKEHQSLDTLSIYSGSS